MKTLVTGAAGFIGSNLVEALLARGDKVIGFDNLSTGRVENVRSFEGKTGFEFVRGDIRDEGLLRKVCAGVDVIFHEAALPSVQRSIANPRETFDTNTGGTMNVLLAAKDAGVKRVIFASSSSIYGNADVQPVHERVAPNPISPYGASKLAAEGYGLSFAASFGFVFIALRYFNVFGPRQDPKSEYAAVVPKFISSLNNASRPVIYGTGLQTRDFTFVGNVVRANLLAADKTDAPSGALSGAYNIAAGSPHTVKDLLETLCAISGKPYQPKFEDPRAGDIFKSSADIGKARERLGYSAATDLRAGLEITYKAFATLRSSEDPSLRSTSGRI